MAVLDSVPASSTLRNLWHFGPSLRVTSNHDGRVVLADGDWRATLLQFAMPSCRSISGQTVRPGAISPRYLEKAEVATVLSPPVSSVLTLIVPGTGDPKVSWSGATVTVGTPGGPVSFASSPDQLCPVRAIG
jgi:hypothetical protein